MYEDNQKVFIKAQIELSLSLGQLIKVGANLYPAVN